MVRPEPCVLFAQAFVHPNLDEYVDEVLFAEPVVISACEFLEQNVSSASPAVTLNGATSPPSFALEVFVQCEGGTKFKRLCQPFLYSHSSSNVLEVEAVVTNHLVVRGSYRSLSLVVYGNTAEDLGQFKIEVDLDSSLTDTVCSVEGNLDDLPPALHPRELTVEDSISHLKELSLKLPASDISEEFKQFLLLAFKILEQSNHEDSINKVVNSVVSAASNYAGCSFHCTAIIEKQFAEDKSINWGESNLTVTEALKELQNVYNSLEHESQNLPVELLSEDMFLESEADLATSKQLVNIFTQYFSVTSDCEIVGHPKLSQYKNVILWLSMALFFTSGKESCYHFVNVGGMEQLGHVFSHSLRNSTAVLLLLLGVVEQATRYSIGCEGFLGWWPREDESIPSGVSEGYNHLLKLLLEKQRHDVASLATYILHRLRIYEVASRFECMVLSILGGLSDVGRVTNSTLDMLTNAKHQLKKLLNMINSRGLVEDPSPVASARKSSMLGETEGLLSYRSTSCLISLSTCGFSNWDIDLHLLFLLKERGFLPLSVALLSCSILRSEVGHALELFVDVTSYIEAIILSFLLCRSGLSFLLLDPELSTTIIRALRGYDNLKTEESVPLRYASSLISKGFFCRPQEVGIIVQTHLRVVSAVDRLIRLSPHSEETLWVLWELCGLSRSDCGRQALLAVSHFSEAVSVLISTLHLVKELDPVSPNSGASPLNLAIFHSAAEIFEVIVTDSTASSLRSWVEHAKELQRALLASSPGSNRKDAPTRLLEWIDAGVVYHSNGAAGLLRYAAVSASGGDAHIATSSILSSESMDVENGVGDASSSSDGNVIDNVLGKAITEKKFPGVSLADSTIAQLTTAFRVLACISENSAVAAALYDEGAVMVVHAVLIDCKLMLERSSNNYDYLVDEGAECSSTSDLLLERTREQGLIDLLIPCLILLINLLQRLQEAKEIHRNRKLMSALVQLHQEVSPKLAASSTDLSYPYPAFALGFEAVCHLIVSALACWPIYGWTPGLLNFLVDSLKATSLLALGPKETCSLLCLLNDLFPEEGTWPWKNGMPVLSTLRTLAVGTLLGPGKERQVNWYLQPGFPEKLLDHLTPQLGMLGQIILHCALSMLVVMQDMLRVFIIRIACLNSGDASILLQPIIKWICDHLDEELSDTDAYKVYRLLDFLAILLEHPRAKGLLLKEGAVKMLMRVLERCLNAANLEAKQCLDGRNVVCGFSSLSWCIPACKLISQISDSQTFEWPRMLGKPTRENLTAEDCAVFLSYLLRLCKVFPVGRELLACLSSFKELGACTEAQNALLMILSHVRSSGTEEGGGPGNRHEKHVNHTLVNTFEWKKQPPLLSCWTSLLRSIDSEDVTPVSAIEAVHTLSEGALRFCMDGESLNLDRVVAVKYLFGLLDDINGTDGAYEENMKCVQHLMVLLDTKVSENDYSFTPDMSAPFCQVKQSVKSLLLLLEKPVDSIKPEDKISAIVSPSLIDLGPSRIHKVTDGSSERVDDYNLYGFGDKFFWECPQNDRLSQSTLPVKRKSSSLDGANRRSRGDNAPVEPMAQAPFSRGSGLSTGPPGPTRRDTFRQRKPNTSRPPSMHVDDYVARERNVDGASSSNVIAVPRVGCTSGRPPSIHVDEFMARQRERQNPVGNVVNDVVAAQVKTAPPEKDTNEEKLSKLKHLKPDLDDDLQGIDIVFDAEEAEPDDRLPFPQADDNLQQPAPIMGEQRSPHSVVEETESDFNENNQSELSSRMSVSCPEMSLAREPSTSSDKKYFEQHDDPSRISSGFASSATATTVYNKASGLTVESRAPADFYAKNIQQTGVAPLATGSQGFYDQRFSVNQPPLPPMPPPSMSTVLSKVPDYVHGQSSPFVMADLRGSQPTEYSSAISNCSSSLLSSSPLADSKYAQISLSSPGCSARPPPLPPTPPPYSATPTLSSLRPSTAQASVYNHSNFGASEMQTSVASSTDARLNNFSASGAILTSYQPPPLLPPMLINRPSVVPMSLYGNSPSSHQGENQSSILQNLPTPLPAIHSLQSLAQLQPLQPPQLPRLPQPPPHLRPSIVASPQSDQGVSLMQSSVPAQLQSLQPLQQSHVSAAHAYFQTHQQENFPHTLQQQQVELSQPQVLHQQDVTSQQHDAGMSLQHFFSSPEAIQSLLSDRDKLCQLLEQHPKLMQMLQERLGQL